MRSERFLAMVPVVEREMIIGNSIILRKYFLDVSQTSSGAGSRPDQDPMRHWKLSPWTLDRCGAGGLHGGVPAHDQGHPCRGRHGIVPADKKRSARLNLIRHLLDSIPDKKVDVELPRIPKVQRRPGKAPEGLSAGQVIPSRY
jgi:hypothetical protein